MSNTSHILRTGQIEREQTDLGVTKSYLAAIESQMEQLKELIKENSTKQEEIIALRDGVRLILPLLQFFYSPRSCRRDFLSLTHAHIAFQRLCRPRGSNNCNARRKHSNSNVYLNALPTR
jgi:hypothetical protein